MTRWCISIAVIDLTLRSGNRTRPRERSFSARDASEGFSAEETLVILQLVFCRDRNTTALRLLDGMDGRCHVKRLKAVCYVVTTSTQALGSL